MKTTVEVPDNLYRQIKARAALQGQTIKAFFIEALREKLTSGTQAESAEEAASAEVGWRAVFGKGDKEAIAEVQKIIDDEFSQIDPEGWDIRTDDES